MALWLHFIVYWSESTRSTVFEACICRGILGFVCLHRLSGNLLDSAVHLSFWEYSQLTFLLFLSWLSLQVCKQWGVIPAQNAPFFGAKEKTKTTTCSRQEDDLWGTESCHSSFFYFNKLLSELFFLDTLEPTCQFRFRLQTSLFLWIWGDHENIRDVPCFPPFPTTWGPDKSQDSSSVHLRISPVLSCETTPMCRCSAAVKSQISTTSHFHINTNDRSVTVTYCFSSFTRGCAIVSPNETSVCPFKFVRLQVLSNYAEDNRAAPPRVKIQRCRV